MRLIDEFYDGPGEFLPARADIRGIGLASFTFTEMIVVCAEESHSVHLGVRVPPLSDHFGHRFLHIGIGPAKMRRTRGRLLALAAVFSHVLGIRIQHLLGKHRIVTAFDHLKASFFHGGDPCCRSL